MFNIVKKRRIAISVFKAKRNDIQHFGDWEAGFTWGLQKVSTAIDTTVQMGAFNQKEQEKMIKLFTRVKWCRKL